MLNDFKATDQQIQNYADRIGFCHGGSCDSQLHAPINSALISRHVDLGQSLVKKPDTKARCFTTEKWIDHSVKAVASQRLYSCFSKVPQAVETLAD